MAVTIKSQREIEIMREAGKILAFVHEELAKMVRPGISTMDLNKKADELMRKYGCIPSFLGYNGYPASICTSVNDEVIHGIPDKRCILQEGDIISIDAGVILKGYQSDAARTWGSPYRCRRPCPLTPGRHTDSIISCARCCMERQQNAAQMN